MFADDVIHIVIIEMMFEWLDGCFRLYVRLIQKLTTFYTYKNIMIHPRHRLDFMFYCNMRR